MFDVLLYPHADPLNWPYADRSWPIILTMFSYIVFVLKLGPKLMQNREPFKLKGALKVYNIFQILFNTVLLIVSLYFLFKNNPYDFNCIIGLPKHHKLKNTERIINYLYFINKILDLMDTVFFVLRKSYKQITTLHLIHHVYMATAPYFWIRAYGYGGHYVFPGLLNLFVHIVMYIYYYLSSQNPLIKKSIWWKQYITILQMVQFVLMFSHSLWTYMQPNCAVPFPKIFLVMFMSALMFVLFTNFYIKAYTGKKKTK